MEKITPFLWFDDNAEEAVAYYLEVFPDSEITQVTHYPEGMPMPAGTVLTIAFTLNGHAFTAMNGGPAFKFSEAVSFVVHCEDQDEIDHYWNRLAKDGSPMACGWLKDKYGLAWQIVPARFFEMISSDDKERAARVLAAMNTMVKFDIAGLEAAYDAVQRPRFKIQELVGAGLLHAGSDELTIVAELAADGEPVRGSDKVRTVPSTGKEEEVTNGIAP